MSITFGSESAFLTAGTFYISVAKLTPSSIVVAYRDNTDGHGEAIVGTISGITVTFNTPTEFLSADGVFYNSVAALDSSKFVVVYEDSSDADHGTARIGTVSGTTITFGNEVEFLASDGAAHNSVTAINASGFVVVYQDNADSNHGTAKFGTVSGTTITFGNEAEFLTADGAYYTSVATLDENKFVVAYRDGADSNHGTAKIGTVSGTTITFGAEAEFLAANGALSISVATLDETKFVVAYWDGADFNHGTVKIGTVSGTTITFGVETEFLSGTGSEHIYVITLDESTFIVLYYDTTDSGHGTAKIGTISGTSITFSEGVEFESGGAADYISAATLNSSKFAVAYRDQSTSNWGTVRIGSLPTEYIASGDLFIYGYNDITASGDLFIHGHTEYNTSDDLFINGYVETSGISTPSLFIHGHIDNSASGDLFVGGHNPLWASGDLYLIGPQQLTDSHDLFVHGHSDSIASGNLFIHGHKDITISGDLFIVGPRQIIDSNHLFIYGLNNAIVSGNLFIEGLIDTSGWTPSLFVHGQNAIQASGNLFIHGHEPIITSGNLFICGPELSTASGDLFIWGHNDINISGDLLINGHEPLITSGNLFIHGYEGIISSGDLLVKGHVDQNTSGDLITAGQDGVDTSGDLYIDSHETFIAFGDLFIHGPELLSISSDLFLHGYVNNVLSGNLFIYGHFDKAMSGNLFIHGDIDCSASDNLFIHGHDIIPVSGDLWIHGHNDIVAFNNLFTVGPRQIIVSNNFFIHGDIDISGIQTPSLFIHGHLEHNVLGHLFANGHEVISISGDLYMDGHESPDISGDLFVMGPQQIIASGDLLTWGHIDTSVSGELFIHGHMDSSTSGNLYIWGHETVITSGNLFIHGHADNISSGDLFVHGHLGEATSGDLFIDGHIDISGISAPSLIIHGHQDIVASGDLYINGHKPIITSGYLFVHGNIEISGIPAPSLFIHGHIIDSGSIGLFIFGIEPLAQSIDWLLKSSDHYPQIIGTLENATSVTIQLWEVTDGQNALVTVVSSDCYQIGNTGRWAWSTANLPTYSTYQRQYFYIMTANHNNTFAGQFFLEVPEKAKWIYPRNYDEYLK